MNHDPSPRQIERAMSQALQVKAFLQQDEPDTDNLLLADMIEGETDVMEIIDRIVETSIADKMLVEAARGRAQRLEQRAERCRNLALRMMEELGLQKIERGAYTASLCTGPRVALIENANEIPEAFKKSSPDKDLITKALKNGETVPGAVLNNPKTVIRVLTR